MRNGTTSISLPTFRQKTPAFSSLFLGMSTRVLPRNVCPESHGERAPSARRNSAIFATGSLRPQAGNITDRQLLPNKPLHLTGQRAGIPTPQALVVCYLS